VQHLRLDGERARANVGERGVGRHLAPPEEVLVLLRDDRGEERLCLLARGVVARGEHEAHAVITGLREPHPELRALVAEELVGQLDEDAGAVAGVHLAAARPSVVEVLEGKQAVAHNLVRALPLQVHEEPDAARVVLVCRVVESLGGWQSWSAHGVAPSAVWGRLTPRAPCACVAIRASLPAAC
jgi:hypothetical protein